MSSERSMLQAALRDPSTRRAAAYEREFGSKLGGDAILGAAWEQQLRGLIAMLNGSCGRLDAGMVDSSARALHRLAGFEGEL